MSQRHGEGGSAWTLSNVVVGEDMITLKMVGYDNEAGSDQACQQALGVKANVVVKVRACQDVSNTFKGGPVLTDTSNAGNYGQQIAHRDASARHPVGAGWANGPSPGRAQAQQGPVPTHACRDATLTR
jgi:hypothetical protein